MDVLITGGAGFIGANLVRRLIDCGHRCVVLDDLSTGTADNLDGIAVEFVGGSVRDAALLSPLLARCDAVVHLAGITGVPPSLRDPLRTHQVNVSGTLEVLEAARAAGGRHVVLAGSAAVYGQRPPQPQHEGLAVAPGTPYAASKAAAEHYALAYAASFDVPVLALRFFNVYGPLQAPGHAYAAVVPAFVAAALEGRPLVVDGDGLQTRDFTYVATVVDVLVRALTDQVTDPGPVNLASGVPNSLLDLITALEVVLDRRLPILHQLGRAGDVRHSRADTTRLDALFPDRTPVSLQEGLRRTVEWMTGRLDG